MHALLSGLIPFASAIIVPHVYLDKACAASVMHKWRPLVKDRVASLQEVSTYSKARALLDVHATGALLQCCGKRLDHLFLIHHDNDITTVLASLRSEAEDDDDLESRMEDMATAMQLLQEWHDSTFPYSKLLWEDW